MNRRISAFALYPLLFALVGAALSVSSLAWGAPPPHPAPATASGGEDAPVVVAAKLKAQANQAMIEMHYADALALYTHAREVVPDDVTVLYSIGRANEFLGDFPASLEALERFAHDAPAEAKARVGQIDALLTELRARVGTVAVTCNVEGARVLVRDRYQGATPLAPFRANAGAATVEVTLDGFFPERRDIVLSGGGTTSIEVTLRKRATSGVLGVTSEPLGAQIFIDGKPEGTSSPRVEVSVESGAHRVVAHREGYDDAIVPVVVAPGESRDVGLKLDPSVPITKKWWFWTGVGVVVVGGVVVAAALLTDKHADSGSLPPGQIAAPLKF
jgi:hypothetical protein